MCYHKTSLPSAILKDNQTPVYRFRRDDRLVSFHCRLTGNKLRHPSFFYGCEISALFELDAARNLFSESSKSIPCPLNCGKTHYTYELLVDAEVQDYIKATDMSCARVVVHTEGNFFDATHFRLPWEVDEEQDEDIPFFPDFCVEIESSESLEDITAPFDVDSNVDI